MSIAKITITGLPRSFKSTIAQLIAEVLKDEGIAHKINDEDVPVNYMNNRVNILKKQSLLTPVQIEVLTSNKIYPYEAISD